MKIILQLQAHSGGRKITDTDLFSQRKFQSYHAAFSETKATRILYLFCLTSIDVILQIFGQNINRVVFLDDTLIS